ncbi:MMPL family transporter [Mycobacterium tuberculosis]|uniref:MMPL family transporter n=1 Tax=Mycobacterium tuberculosis TaxID=1773 RepID=UPI0008AA5302|nr:MMPL family transporter [Mycobacterium tuberculosis]SGD83074.1 transmembrane transporter mmpL13b [Mycobacterium tuberculosis]SGI92250.1 transmembrane transporter mmpL13b [Mycobacterium tuberculosis]SGP21585.1 transmembrane transporter mmpL13b [Mycobacterium tuberculosis]SGQ46581.1 transmembrane transporter mmpL13b [Mycobacterium tuberculosis]SGR82479.1 transmembrane transporter mmpL13b [Mycobacterium tuberculosis]
MLQRIARLAIAAPRRIIGFAVFVFIAAAVFGVPVADSLSPGGFQDPRSESARAIEVLTDKFGQSGQKMLIVVTAAAGADSPPAREVGTDIVEVLRRSPLVYNVTSPWTVPPTAAADLLSTDGKSGLIVVNVKGGENDAQNHAQTLSDEVAHDRDGVTVRAGGSAMEYAQINRQNKDDLLVMELIAIPLSFLVLIWVFGGLLAAGLPMAQAVLAVVGSMAVLRLVYAGVATVAFVATASIVITPAAIVLLGPRLDALDVRRLVRRLLGRPDPVHKPVKQLFWYRSSKFVMRRWLPVGTAVVALLVLLGLPFLSVKWGFPDDRVLPRSASARQVGDILRDDFGHDPATQIPIVVPDARGLGPVELDSYAAELSRVPDVSAVAAPTGTFVDGSWVGTPRGATGLAEGSAFLTVSSTAPLFSRASDIQLKRLHQVAGPAGRSVVMAGVAQVNRDSVDAVTDRLPMVLGLIAAITYVLLFLLTGSVVLPAKALVCNVLSLTAAFGALVWIFQEGHFGALGTTPSGTLVANMPVLLFCIAFGLSMDYEVFLVSRIREYWLESGAARPARRSVAEVHAANDESVALGVARTGRVITAAALVMSMSFAALIAAHVSFMRMFGLGLTLAVAADATLVRMVVVPAFMHVTGRWNWWAPRPLAWLHERFGVSEAAEPVSRRRSHAGGLGKIAGRSDGQTIPASLTRNG